MPTNDVTVFTSDSGFDRGNIRPLIPLSVDPPRHSKFRILDTFFAPMARSEQ
jgi:hypothetical protein